MRTSDATGRPSLSEALAAALEKLRGRDYFSTELRFALERNPFPQEEIDYAIEVAHRRNFVNDDRLARDIAHRLDFKKHFGPNRIRAELERRKAPEASIEKALKSLKPETETIRYSVADLKRRGTHTPAQLARKLMSRGFSEEAIRGVIEEMADD